MYFDHLFEVVSEGSEVVLCVFGVFGHEVEIEFDVLLVLTEELLLYLLFDRFLFCFLLEDLLDLAFVRVLLTDAKFVVVTQAVHAGVVKIGGHHVSSVVLAHAQSVDG